jgi:putative ABC transport system permease protein
MLARILRGVPRVGPGRLALVLLSTIMGSGIAAALGAVAIHAGDRIAAELRRFGANVVVEPALVSAPAGGGAPAGHLEERDLERILTIFWRHNVVGLAPALTAPAQVAGPRGQERAVLAGLWFDRALARPGGGGELRAGVVPLFPFWELSGAWPGEGAADEAVVGQALAGRLGVAAGGRVAIEAGGRVATFRVTGLLRAGGFEDEQVMVPLAVAQALLGRPGQVSRALVSAVTVPLDAFGRSDPGGLTPREYEKWFCTPYVTSVARQVQEAVPGSRARPLWTMAEAEARVLTRLDLLLFLLAGLTLLAAALAVASTFAARVMGRRVEIALLRACGAGPWQLALLLGSEVLALGALGGLLGAGLAYVLVGALGVVVFGAPIDAGLVVVPLALGGSTLVAAAGALWPIRRALSLDPASELKEAA